jgi:tetratricopeptide (TPR) repeat protein
VLASTDPKAVMRQREAQYYLGVGLFQQRDYREAVTQLGKFLSVDGASAQLTQEATYLRFKATEGLYAKEVSDENAKLYIDAIKDFIRRYPNHKSIFEAYFRLGEYNQKQQQYLSAVDAYQKVNGDPTFRVRADFATLQSYFALLDMFDGQDGKQNGAGISESDLRHRIAPSLQTFWKDTADLEKNNPNEAKLVPLHEYRGKVSVMNAVFLSKDADTKAPEILTLLQDFEKKYPEQQDAFAKVTRMRLVAFQKTGRYTDLEQEVQNVFTQFKPEEQPELLAGLTQVLPKDLRKLEKKNDRDNLVAVKRTLARLYADRLQRGEGFAEDESPERFKYDLAQLYLDVKDYDKAASMYQELQHGAYSLVALAGLAQIAAVKGEQRQAISLWEEMLKGTQVGDPLWFRGTFEVAQLHTTLGDTELACKTISGTRPLLGRLGEQGLKKRIQDLTTQYCGK